MNTKQIFFFILLLLLNSCNNYSLTSTSAVTIKDSLVVINIDCLEQGPLIPFDSLFIKYEYIMNEDGDYFQTSGWESCRFDGKENFIGISHLSSTIILYDSLGNFVRNIGKKGKFINRGEFEEIYGYCANPVKQIIYALDNKQGKIFKYNYNNDFLGTVDILTTTVNRSTNNERFRSSSLCDVIEITPDGNLLIHYAYWGGNLDYNYCLINDNNEIITTKKTMGQLNIKTAYRTESSNYTYNNYLHTIDLSDTLYVIKENLFIPKYVFEQKYTLGKMADSLGKDIDIYKINNLIYKISRIQETDTYLFFSYYSINPQKRNHLYDLTHAYYNKQTKNASKLFTLEQIYTYTKDSIPASVILGPNYGKVTFAKNKRGRIKLHLK